MNKYLGFSIVLILLLSVSNVFGVTASIANARMVLYANITDGEPTIIEKSISVININNESVSISVKPSEEFENITTIINKSFILLPDESKDANFLLNISSSGKYIGRIFVDFQPLNDSFSKLNVSGVGLASHITVVGRNLTAFQKFEAQNNETNSTNPSLPEEADPDSFGPVLILASLLLIIFYLHFKKGVKK